MKVKPNNTFIKLIGILLIIPLLVSAKTNSIRMGVIPFAPYYYTNENGQQDGWMYKIIKKISHKLDRQLRTKDLTPKRAIKEMASGNIDFIIALKTFKGIEKIGHIGNHPLARIRLSAYSVGKTKPMKKYSDLIGKDVIMVQGYSYGGLASFVKNPENKVTYHVVGTHALGLKMMKHSRADYLIAYKGPTESALKNYPIPNLSSTTIKELSVYFVFSKKMDGSKTMLENYEKLYLKETDKL